AADLPVTGMLFGQTTEFADGARISSIKPDERRTNLGGAIAEALSKSDQIPLAVIALTDGDVNDDKDNSRALNALVDTRVPFIGVGFGSDQDVETLSLRSLRGPSEVRPGASFTLCASLELINAQDSANLDAVLFRDGEAVQKKTIPFRKGSG